MQSHHAPGQPLAPVPEMIAQAGMETLMVWLSSEEPVQIVMDGVRYTITVTRASSDDG